MKFSLYSKKNVLDEMQEQTLRKIGERGFCLMWGGLLAAMVIQWLTGNAEKAIGEWVVFMAGCVYTCAECVRNGLWDRHLSPSMGANAVCSLLAAVAVTVLCGLAYGYWMGAAFTGASTGLLCFALLQFCVHLMQKNRKKLDDEPEEK